MYLVVFARLALKPGMAYFDAGCGAGMAAQIAAEKGAPLYGLDAAPNLFGPQVLAGLALNYKKGRRSFERVRSVTTTSIFMLTRWMRTLKLTNGRKWKDTP